jgi:hypothetical protein
MSFAAIALIALMVLCLVEIILGIARRSAGLVAVGVVLLIIAALALYLSVRYSGALYFSDPGHII